VAKSKFGRLNLNVKHYTVEIGFPDKEIEVLPRAPSVKVVVTVLEGELGGDDVISLNCITEDGTAKGIS
jgi:hypothetical protein